MVGVMQSLNVWHAGIQNMKAEKLPLQYSMLHTTKAESPINRILYNTYWFKNDEKGTSSLWVVGSEPKKIPDPGKEQHLRKVPAFQSAWQLTHHLP